MDFKIRSKSLKGYFSGAVFAVVCVTIPVLAQDGEAAIVRPGAPGQPTRILAADARATVPPISAKDIEFMQGMIMHHAQAVEMTALIDERTTNKEVRLLGARISQSQSDEMMFMKGWLLARGQQVEMKMPEMKSGHNHGGHSSMDHSKSMPGMLSPEQMTALSAAKGIEFDRLFLAGMVQHHKGALVMVKELFDSPGSGQNPELFSFATDVDSGQRAEIRIMQTMLGEKP